MQTIQLARLATAAVLTVGSIAAHADRTAYDLRYLELNTSNIFIDKDGNSNTQSTESSDRFNNGDPYTGISYQRFYNGGPNGGPVAGGYQASTFTPGAELNGAAGDFVGNRFGVGGLSFRYADATKSTSNLTPAGFESYSLSLSPSVVPNTALGLVARNGSFSVFSLWNYSELQPGESFVIGLGGTGGSNYVDRLQLRFGANFATGLQYISFEQQSRTGFPGNPVLTRTTLAGTTPGAIFGALADVDYIGLGLERDLPTVNNPNPGVHASITLFDAALGSNNDLKELATFTFGAEGQTFLTAGPSGDFSSVFVNGNWFDPPPVVSPPAVPEPSTYALLALGLGAVGFVVRRRKA